MNGMKLKLNLLPQIRKTFAKIDCSTGPLTTNISKNYLLNIRWLALDRHSEHTL